MSDERVSQAPDELANRRIWAITLASLAVTAVALAVSWALLERWGGAGRAPSGRPPPAAPRTIGILEQSLVLTTDRGAELRREQAAALARWEWVDRDAGVARIPIEVAMDILADAPPAPERPLADEEAP